MIFFLQFIIVIFSFSKIKFICYIKYIVILQVHIAFLSHDEQLQEIKIVLQRPKFSKYIHPHELDEFITC